MLAKSRALARYVLILPFLGFSLDMASFLRQGLVANHWGESVADLHVIGPASKVGMRGLQADSSGS